MFDNRGATESRALQCVSSTVVTPAASAVAATPAAARSSLVAERSWVAVWWHSRYGARLLIEFGLMYALLTVYRFVRTLKSADLVTAFSHSADVQRIEGWLSIPNEASLQHLVLQVPFGIEVLNRYYVWVHFPAVFALVGGLYIFRPEVYRPVRTLLTVVTFSALVIHLVYPLAPPRMMESFVDTIQIYGPSVYPPSSFDGVANQIAAMPSLHFGWALIEAISVIWAFNSRWRWLALAHPTMMTVAIVATANHWWADAFVAGMLILAALPIVFAVERRFDRPAVSDTERFGDRQAGRHDTGHPDTGHPDTERHDAATDTARGAPVAV